MLNEVRTRLQDRLASLTDTDLSGFILRVSSGTFAVKIAGAGLGFLLQVVLTRTLGADQYGIYIYALTWAQLVAMLGAFGFQTASVRFVSEYRGQQSFSLLRGYLQFSRWTSFLISAGLGVLFAGLAVLVYSPSDTLTTFLVAASLPVAQSAMAVRLAELRGMQHVVLGQTIEQVVRPAFVIGCVGAAGWLGVSVFSYEAMVVYVIGTALALGVAMWSGHRILPDALGNTDPLQKQWTWFRTARDMMLIAGFHLVLMRADTIMVGSLVGTTESGLYAIASRVSGLLSFVLVAVNSNLGPMIADFHAGEEEQKLRSIVTFGARVVMACSAAAALVLYGLGEWVLSLFGPSYVEGFWVMMVLVGGQIANAWTGPAVLLLNMTGHESTSARIQSASAILNIGLNAAFILWLGPIGAALATALSIAFRNGIAALIVRRRLGVDPSFLGMHASR